MNIFLGLLGWIGIFLLYFIIEFIINLFFTYKISYVTKNDYNKAAITGAIATFLFMFSTLLAMLLSSNISLMSFLFMNNTSSFEIEIWMQIIYLLITTISFAIGNFAGTISIPKINKFLKREDKK
ncbi:MAG: hypothetical protein HRS50_01810 [Mycoplasmataceae bacterium]|nr:hypothetical protein [Mycoplasmataceae bacterium]